MFYIANFRLVKAATGTGKTLAYLAPIVHLLQMREPRVDRTHGTFGNYLCLFMFPMLLLMGKSNFPSRICNFLSSMSLVIKNLNVQKSWVSLFPFCIALHQSWFIYHDLLQGLFLYFSSYFGEKMNSLLHLLSFWEKSMTY
jgi:hypothetical protein